jgi:hypothetical protein
MADEKEKKKVSGDYEYGTPEYFQCRVKELEEGWGKSRDEVEYYRTELAKAHEILGRVIHQLSERWDSVRLTKYYPTDNLSGQRTINNPSGKKDK